MSKINSKPTWAINAETLMKKKGIQKLDLLDIFGVSTPAAVGHYFQGRREPSIQGLINLAQKLDVELSSLLGLQENTHLNIKEVNAQRLTEALQLLVRCVDITPEEVMIFFKVYEKINPENIIKSINILSESDDKNSIFNSIIKVQDFMSIELKKANK
ncbi:helix-turn-helix domain-containing protein [Shewanella surugensis]|uniref:Helix-turn-helix transcriptional regulator n=1 Tax=Shewanella surugensis TaxID=212020 RepID=A0ABT0L7R1_9GAMM|nr:helix-turn-helix transcriptional regulator [Shewanella surugensis]MCL1123417.1 helix-turn-helix transcriptional regulator [Shewanella surugensis]